MVSKNLKKTAEKAKDAVVKSKVLPKELKEETVAAIDESVVAVGKAQEAEIEREKNRVAVKEKIKKEKPKDPNRFFDSKRQQEIIKKMNKVLGEKEKVTTGDDVRLKTYKLPVASLGVTKKTSGGFARKRIHLIWGAKSSGKSFFDYATVAILQRLCRNCLGVLDYDDRIAAGLRYWFGFDDCACDSPEAHRCLKIDYENDYQYEKNPEDSEIFKKKESHIINIGIIPEQYTIMFASSIDECIDIMKEFIPELYFDWICLDSLQGGQTEYVFGKAGNEETMGVDPKKLNTLFRDINYVSNNIGIDNFRWLPVIVLISQVRMKITPNMSYEGPSGGKGLEHFNAFSMQLSRREFVNEKGSDVQSTKGGDIVAQHIHYKNDKMKIDRGEPYFIGDFTIYLEDHEDIKKGDYDYLSELIDLGIERGIIEGTGWYTIGHFKKKDDGKGIQGKDQLRAFLRTKKEAVKYILDRV